MNLTCGSGLVARGRDDTGESGPRERGAQGAGLRRDGPRAQAGPEWRSGALAG